MSFLNPEIFTIDISDRSLKLLKLARAGSRIRLASVLKRDIEEGIVMGGEIVDQKALGALLKNSVKEVKGEPLRTLYAAASLPEEKTFLRIIQIPQVSPEDLPAVVLQEAENHIPFPIEEAAISFQVVGPTREKQDHLDILLVAFPSSFVRAYTDTLKNSGFIPVLLEPESLAIARALVSSSNNESLLLIDFGATQTSFIIFSRNSVRFTSSISFSGSTVTNAIREVTKSSAEEAEKIKLGANQDQTITAAIEPSLKELSDTIKKQLAFYQDHASHEHRKGEVVVERILLAGGGALLPGLAQYLARDLRIDVDLGNPWAGAGSGKIENSLVSYQESLPYATAIGMALGVQNFFT